MTPTPTGPGHRPRIAVVDAPGGPHPSLYLPSLLRHFDVEVLSLDVESGGARERRARALAAVPAAGGRLTTLGSPEDLPDALAEALRTGGAEGVVAFSERVVHAAQRVAWRAGLPANPPEALDALQDKRAQRRLMRAAGLPVPQVRELHGPREVREAVRSAAFPAVLKPAVGMGSLATFRVEEPGDLPALWETARALAHADARVGHLRPAMLLEEELVGDPRRARDGLGDYLSVEALMVDGELCVLAVSDKLPLSRPFRENGHILPALRPAEECEEAVAHVRQAHAALGIRFGATHTEVKLTADGPRVIEVNGRVGGSVPEQLLLTAGYDLPLNLARTAVGLTPEVHPVHRRWSAYLTPQPPCGRHTVERTPTAAELAAVPGVSTVHHVVQPGEVVDSAAGTASNLLRVVAATDTPQELFDLAARLGGPDTFTLRPFDPTKVSATHG
ncbi:acetyl-CoA carboxylase biotin carboxylase subunit family protein [Kitasatospora sp. NPDC093550]|uniref:ATP-grasp domain-containing protein n=1 Tax=Kitasatospora sp. NPDC093550 TaxID=3364089 RepID=UPI0038220527